MLVMVTGAAVFVESVTVCGSEGLTDGHQSEVDGIQVDAEARLHGLHGRRTAAGVSGRDERHEKQPLRGRFEDRPSRAPNGDSWSRLPREAGMVGARLPEAQGREVRFFRLSSLCKFLTGCGVVT